MAQPSAALLATIRAIDQFTDRSGTVITWLAMILVLAVSYEVIARYAFNAPTIWVHDMVIVLSAVCFVFGGAVATQQRNHIQMASYFDLAPAPVRRLLDMVCHVLTAAYMGMFLFASIKLAIPSLQLMETSGRAWDVPIPVFLKTIMVIGSAHMLAQTLSHLWHGQSQKPASTQPGSGETIV